MATLELIRAGNVERGDKVREKGEDESDWVIVETVESKGEQVAIEAYYHSTDDPFLWGVYAKDYELEAER